MPMQGESSGESFLNLQLCRTAELRLWLGGTIEPDGDTRTIAQRQAQHAELESKHRQA